MQPDLSVIIVTYNGREKALATLRSGLAATGAARVQWIVVDSGSRDGVCEAIEATWPEVEVIYSGNHGFAAGNNVGLRRARGRYMLLMNPDIEIARGDLGELVALMDARPEVGIASVIQRGADGRLQRSIRRFPSILRDLGESLFSARWPVLGTFSELELRDARYETEHSVDWMVGAFLIARAEAVRTVGLMDERYFLYSEEIDWCYRIRQHGWDARHLPQLSVVHHVGGRDRGDLMAQLAQSRKLFAHKHFGPFKSRSIRASLVLGHVLRLITLAPAATRSPSGRSRMRAEYTALAVQSGLRTPPALGAGARPPQVPGGPERSFHDALSTPNVP
jgi:N-acetylglucosaminyl-diphospho-decaprenol L-rhamnosyltransferase